MAKPKVAICSRKCKGRRKGAFHACVKRCVKTGKLRGRKRRR